MQQHLLEFAGHTIAAVAANGDRPGTPVVFLHGITASIDFWRHSLPPAILNERPWISLSLPGHAPSRFPPAFAPSDVTLELFSSVPMGALQTLVGDRPVDLVGWSTGGFCALNLAAQFPRQVRSVLSISGFAKGNWRGVIGRMQRLVALSIVGRRLFHEVWTQLGRKRWLFDWAVGQAAANRRAFWASPATVPTLDGWQAAIRSHDLGGLAVLFERLADLDLRPLLPSIAVPTMIVGGDRDPYIPVQHTRELAHAIPGSELRILPDTGHMFFAECTGEYHRLLLDWIGRRRNGASTPP